MTEAGATRDAPAPKKQATAAGSAKPGVVAVKKETTPIPKASSSSAAVINAAKSDSSFFSAPKAKPKLPSFKKAMTAPTANAAALSKQNDVAQPMSLNPFADALKSLDKSRLGTPPLASGAQVASAPANHTIASASEPSVSSSNKKKRVSFAPDNQLVSVRWIERAVYDQDPSAAEDVVSVCSLPHPDKHACVLLPMFTHVCRTENITILGTSTGKRVSRCTNTSLKNSLTGTTRPVRLFE